MEREGKHKCCSWTCFYEIQFNFLSLTCGGGEKSMQPRVKRFNARDGSNGPADAALAFER